MVSFKGVIIWKKLPALSLHYWLSIKVWKMTTSVFSRRAGFTVTALTWNLRNSNYCLSLTMIWEFACMWTPRSGYDWTMLECTCCTPRASLCHPEQKHWGRKFKVLHYHEFIYYGGHYWEHYFTFWNGTLLSMTWQFIHNNGAAHVQCNCGS